MKSVFTGSGTHNAPSANSDFFVFWRSRHREQQFPSITAFKERDGTATSQNIIHFSTVFFAIRLNHFQTWPMRCLNVNLPHAPRIWTLFRKSLHFSFLSSRFPNCFSFSLPPSRSETRATFLKKGKKTPDQSLPTPDSARLPSSSTLLSSQLYSGLRASLPLSTPSETAVLPTRA